MTRVPGTTLSNGLMMPNMLLGSFQLRSAAALNEVVDAALAYGAYGFDTSPSYSTEKPLGAALHAALENHPDVSREDLFIQTKVDAWQMIKSGGDVKPFVVSALMKMDLSYFDSVLIHWPQPDYLVATWKCLERLYDEGMVRAIGVCNVERRHIEALAEGGARYVPHIVQNEIHPLRADAKTCAFIKEQGIALQAYSPLARMIDRITTNDELNAIADRHRLSIAQVMLAWHLQEGRSPIVKTSKASRVAENFSAFDVTLSREELITIDRMSRNIKLFLESRCCPGY